VIGTWLEEGGGCGTAGINKAFRPGLKGDPEPAARQPERTEFGTASARNDRLANVSGAAACGNGRTLY